MVRASAKASCAAAASGSACCRATHCCHGSGRQPQLTRTCWIMATVASPPWQCNSTAWAERQRTTTSSPGSAAESPDGQSPVGLGIEASSAAGVEVRGDRRQAPGPSTSRLATAPRPGGVNKISRGNFFLGMSASLRIWYPHRAGIRRVRVKLFTARVFTSP